MTNQHKRYVFIAISVFVLEAWALYVVSRSYAHWCPAMIVKDEPQAHALYDRMIHTMRNAESLSYSVAVFNEPGPRVSRYQIELKKPHASRVNVTNGMTGKTTTLVSDGQSLWVHWSGTRMYWKADTAESYEKTKSNVFIKKPVAGGLDSIAGEIAGLGSAWFDLIWDPSLVHAHGDPYAPTIDGIRSRGTDRVRNEVCDVIEISYMHAQRTRYVWISSEDHLPRKTKEILRRAENHVTVSQWSKVNLDAPIPASMFVWSPPVDHTQWHLPEPEASLLKSGQAPDIALSSPDKQSLSLSDYRGKFVWLYLWQVGSPACRAEMPSLQLFYETHRDSGLVVLGLNITDNRPIADYFLQKNGITFPVFHEPAKAVQTIVTKGYGNRTGHTPFSCIIDKQGNVVDAWYKNPQGHERVKEFVYSND
jgi:peroxiredoxin/outer membrane lipoprotein-sorting protein